MHKVIRKYRLNQTALIVLLSYLAIEFTSWITATPYSELKDWHLAPITAAYPTLITSLFAVATSIRKRNEKDEDDDD